MRQYDYDSLLMDYACGALDEALSLVVAAHLTLSARARAQVALCESLGGALIDEGCGEIRMSADSLNAVLARLDSAPAQKQKTRNPCCTAPCGAPLPAALAPFLHGRRKPRWRTIWPGIAVMPVALPRASGWHAVMIRTLPGRAASLHRHAAPEITLILHGRLHDEHGAHDTGTLLLNAAAARRPVADARTGCICLVAAPCAPGFAGQARRFVTYLLS